MSDRHFAWVTPAEPPGAFECREVLIPAGGPEWEAAFVGALLMLCDTQNWEQVVGVSPDVAADAFLEMFYAFDTQHGRCELFPGMVIPAARSTAPNERWLLCDGAEYAETDYPALYAAIGTAWGSSGAGYFKVPDLRGRAAIGVGQGSGLTNRVLADTGGEETHILSTAEMPSHLHQIAGLYLGPAQSGSGANCWVYNGAQSKNTTSAGSGNAHNTMPPFAALQYFIYAG